MAKTLSIATIMKYKRLREEKYLSASKDSAVINNIYSLIEDTYDCIEWPNARENDYGIICWNDFHLSVHRIVLTKELGREIEKGMVVRHTCDNRRCFNPRHLLEGTQRQNVQDMIERNRANEWVLKICKKK